MTSPSSRLMTRHFGQHLRAEEFSISVGRVAGNDAMEEAGGAVIVQVGGCGRGMAVIRGGAAKGAKTLARGTKGGKVAEPMSSIFSCHCA